MWNVSRFCDKLLVVAIYWNDSCVTTQWFSSFNCRSTSDLNLSRHGRKGQMQSTQSRYCLGKRYVIQHTSGNRIILSSSLCRQQIDLKRASRIVSPVIRDLQLFLIADQSTCEIVIYLIALTSIGRCHGRDSKQKTWILTSSIDAHAVRRRREIKFIVCQRVLMGMIKRSRLSNFAVKCVLVHKITDRERQHTVLYFFFIRRDSDQSETWLILRGQGAISLLRLWFTRVKLLESYDEFRKRHRKDVETFFSRSIHSRTCAFRPCIRNDERYMSVCCLFVICIRPRDMDCPRTWSLAMPSYDIHSWMIRTSFMTKSTHEKSVVFRNSEHARKTREFSCCSDVRRERCIQDIPLWVTCVSHQLRLCLDLVRHLRRKSGNRLFDCH